MLRARLNHRCKRSDLKRETPRQPKSPRALTVEPLDHRLLLSTINWANRGDTVDLNGNGAVDAPAEVGDGFNLAYGSNASLARTIVDRALRDWESVIQDFNYSDGSNTFEVQIFALEQQSDVDFISHWAGPRESSFGSVNSGQSFSGVPIPSSVFINEIHYDTTAGGSKAIELAGPAGTDLQNWTLVLYDGASRSVRDTINLTGVIPDQENGNGTLAFAAPNLPDGHGGIALVDPTSSVARIGFQKQFLSYGGRFTAVGGAADQLSSSDIGVAESSATPANFSLQLTRGHGNRGTTSDWGTLNDRPISAKIKLDNDGGGTGWYFDPTIGAAGLPDDSEFTELRAAFAATIPGNGLNDFYRTVLHELGHAMGLATADGLAITNFITVTDIPDPNGGGMLRAFNADGGAIEATFAGHGTHFWAGPETAETIQLGLPVHPNELMNPGESVVPPPMTRHLISDLTVRTLEQAYGYDVVLPSQINSFYANLNTQNGVLSVQGDLGTAQDLIAIGMLNNEIRVRVNETCERFPAAQVNSVVVQSQAADELFDLRSLPSDVAATINGGCDFDPPQVESIEYASQTVRVHFSEPIDIATFGVDDITIFDLAEINEIPITLAPSPVPGTSSQSWDITVPSFPEGGLILRLGPDIQDLFHHRLGEYQTQVEDHTAPTVVDWGLASPGPIGPWGIGAHVINNHVLVGLSESIDVDSFIAGVKVLGPVKQGPNGPSRDTLQISVSPYSGVGFNPVPGLHNRNFLISFVPDSAMPWGIHTLEIDTDVADIFHNALNSAFSWDFDRQPTTLNLARGFADELAAKFEAYVKRRTIPMGDPRNPPDPPPDWRSYDAATTTLLKTLFDKDPLAPDRSLTGRISGQAVATQLLRNPIVQQPSPAPQKQPYSGMQQTWQALHDGSKPLLAAQSPYHKTADIQALDYLLERSV